MDLGTAAGSQHYMRGFQLGHDLAIAGLNRHLATGRQPASASEHLDLVFLHQIGHAFGQLLGHLAASANDRIPIHGRLINS